MASAGPTGFKVAAFWLVVTAMALGARSVLTRDFLGTFTDPHRWTEAGIHLIVLMGLASLRPVRSVLSCLPLTHRAIITALLVLFIIPQIANSGRRTFPFAAWGMFSKPHENNVVTYYEFIGIGGDSEEVFLRPPLVIPTLARRRLVAKLNELAEHVVDPDATDDDRANLDEALAGMGRAYNHQHDGNSLHAIELYQCQFPLDEYTDAASIDRQRIWRTELRTNLR